MGCSEPPPAKNSEAKATLRRSIGSSPVAPHQVGELNEAHSQAALARLAYEAGAGTHNYDDCPVVLLFARLLCLKVTIMAFVISSYMH